MTLCSMDGAGNELAGCGLEPRSRRTAMPDALSWLGMRIDDAYGARVGDVDDIYLEADGTPRWIFARPGRVLIPAAEAMAGAGRVWVPFEKELIKNAPSVTSLDC